MTKRRMPGMCAGHAALFDSSEVTALCCHVRRARHPSAGLDLATIWLVINSLVSMGVYTTHDTDVSA